MDKRRGIMLDGDISYVSKPGTITILKDGDICYVSTKHHQDKFFLDKVRACSDRFYGEEENLWKYPTEYLDLLFDNLAFNGITYTVTNKTIAICIKVGDTYEVKLSKYVEGLSFSTIENAWYDGAESKYVIPVKSKEEMIRILNENGVECVIKHVYIKSGMCNVECGCECVIG